MSGKVSVIMAVYNCENTVSDAIESILAQTYTNWELIICNDCSTDSTPKIIKKYQEEYPEKIVIIHNDKNSRLPFSLNHCLQYVSGEYVARMDGDDISYPERLETQIKYLREHPDVDLVGSFMDIFDGEKITGVAKNKEKVDKYSLKYSPCFSHATILTYKYVYDKLNGYSLCNRALRCEDVDLWFRFFYAGFTGANIQKSLYRVTDDASALNRRNFKNRIRAMRTLFFGYRLLKYPIYWYPAILNPVIKGLVPRFVYMYFRNRKFT